MLGSYSFIGHEQHDHLNLFVWLWFSFSVATWTAPRWKKTPSLHRLWLATSGLNRLTLSNRLRSAWSCWAATSTVSYYQTEQNLSQCSFHCIKVLRLTVICLCATRLLFPSRAPEEASWQQLQRLHVLFIPAAQLGPQPRPPPSGRQRQRLEAEGEWCIFTFL